MKVFIISSAESYRFAEYLLEDITDAIPLIWQTDLYSETRVRLEIRSSGFFLPVIDSSFLNDQDLLRELDAAVKYSKKYNIPICPVLLENVQIPEQIKNYSCTQIVGDSQESIRFARKKIANYCAQYFDDTNFDSNSKKRTEILALYLAAATVSGVSGTLLVYFGIKQYSSILYQIIPIIGLFAGGFLLILFAEKNREYRRQRSVHDEKIYLQQLKESIVVESSIVPSSEDNAGEGKAQKKDEINALGLMQVNLNNIEKYYKWNQEQAKSAFNFAVFMCIFGFVVFTIAVLLPTVFNASIEAAIITAIAGGIAELVAGTALVVYKSSVEQLYYYHKALHEDERFLSSVNLLGEFSTADKKDEVLHEIINSEISMNTMSYDNTANNQGTKQKKN